MKKILFLAAITMFLGLVSGCTSIPDSNNLTGQWNYKYSKQNKTGSMKLYQEGFKLTGTANDAEGRFNLNGNVKGKLIILNGVCPENNRTFMANLKLDDENSFEGTYTTSSGESGKIKGKR